MGHCVVCFNVVVVLGIVLYVVYAVLRIVSWVFVCVFIVDTSPNLMFIVVTLLAGRISLTLYL